MPTENRSSNTEPQQIEAAGAAMTQIRTMLGREQRPDQVAAALEACDWSDTPIGNKAIILSAIQALRAPQPHPEPIAWMVGTAIWWTKEEAERDATATGLPIVGLGPMTGSGEVERKSVKRYDRDKVCGHSDVEITVPGLLHHDHGPNLAEALARLAYRVAKFHKLDTPSLADSGEVERLTEQLEVANQAIAYAARQAEEKQKVTDALMADAKQFRAERDALRAQLAERDVLPQFAQTVIRKLKRFRDCAEDGQGADIGKTWFDVLVQLGLLNRVQRSPAWWEITDEGDALLDGRAALSASTEPSTPVDIDERAEFEDASEPDGANLDRNSDGDYVNPYVQSSWEGWSMRAALERKPA
ncbi:hypothetical protein QSV36_10130 [Pseudomonas sp. BCRC 81390]|uniref:hypothetical protein n=1 Tax=Pseudomonas sp. BCRC 81390 TaxID=3054778 RepID=UPI00259A21B9|nr:hypothetical protein [Pseudomonas sp. BCRC 81390]MDM3885955.1 hypothetical protein [Pseudomonas sp. BCRC 81390]